MAKTDGIPLLISTTSSLSWEDLCACFQDQGAVGDFNAPNADNVGRPDAMAPGRTAVVIAGAALPRAALAHAALVRAASCASAAREMARAGVEMRKPARDLQRVADVAGPSC
jgi:hypothetical protein